MASFAPSDPTPDYEPTLDALRVEASLAAQAHARVTSSDPRWERLAVLKAERIAQAGARSIARTDRYGR